MKKWIIGYFDKYSFIKPTARLICLFFQKDRKNSHNLKGTIILSGGGGGQIWSGQIIYIHHGLGQKIYFRVNRGQNIYFQSQKKMVGGGS